MISIKACVYNGIRVAIDTSVERRHSVTVDQRDLSPGMVVDPVDAACRDSPDSTTKFFMQTVYEEQVSFLNATIVEA
jgi:hypothetical protein